MGEEQRREGQDQERLEQLRGDGDLPIPGLCTMGGTAAGLGGGKESPAGVIQKAVQFQLVKALEIAFYRFSVVKFRFP